MDRFSAEQIIQQLAGGATPEHQDTLLFDREAGWKFSKSGLLFVLSDVDATELYGTKLKFQNGLFQVLEDEAEAAQVDVGLMPIFDAGDPGATWAPDYLDGACQKATIDAALQINSPTNLPSGSPLILIVISSGGTYDVTFNSANYDGSELVMTAAAKVWAWVLNSEESKFEVTASMR